MKIEIILCNNKNWFMYFISGIVRWAQGVNYSHMAIHFPDMPLQLDRPEFCHPVMDATLRGGVKLNKKAEFDKKHKFVKKKEIYIAATREDVKIFFSKYLGRKYGWTSFIDFGLKKLGLSSTPFFGADEKMMVCSELVAVFIKYFKIAEVNKDIDAYDLMETEKLLNLIE